jgi:hypothetical protein
MSIENDARLLTRHENDALRSTIAALQADNARLLALNGTASAPEWKALKAVDRGPYCYEAVRLWAVGNLIIAEKRRGRWFVQVASMAKRLSELAVSNT